jgi:hypothetical protein
MVFRRRKLTDRVQTVVDEVLHMLQRETQSGFQKHRPSAVQAARLEERRSAGLSRAVASA